MIGTHDIDFLRSAVDEQQHRHRVAADTRRLVRRINHRRRSA